MKPLASCLGMMVCACCLTVFTMAYAYDMEGRSENIAGFLGESEITNSAPGQSVLTATAGGTYANPISGNIRFVSTTQRNNEPDFFKLRGVNSHTGGTLITSGGLQINDPQSLGTGPLEFDGGTLAIAEVGMTLPDTMTVVLHAGGGGIRVQHNGWAAIAGKITGVGGLRIVNDSNHGVTLSNPENDYGGNTIIGSTIDQWDAGTPRLILGNSNVLPDTTTVFFESRNGVLNMNGKSDTITWFEGAGAIQNDSATRSVLTFTTNENKTLDSRISYQGTGEVSLRKTGTGTLTFMKRTNAFSGTFELEAGSLSAYSTGAFLPGERYHVTGDAAVSMDTSANWGAVWVDGRYDYRDQVAPTSFIDNMDAQMNTNYGNSDGSNGIWGDQSAWVFSSTVELTQATQLQFYKDFDDWVYVSMTPINADGSLGTAVVLIDHGTWNGRNISNYSDEFAAGQYLLDVRGGQGGGGVGPQTGGVGVGVRTTFIQEDVAAPDGAVKSSFSKLNFDADGNLAFGENSILKGSGDRIIASDFEIDGGKTLTLRGTGSGSINMTGEVSGAGALAIEAGNTNVTLKGANSHTGGTELSGHVVAANDRAFGDGEIRLGASVTDYTLTVDATDAARTFNNTVNVTAGQHFGVNILGTNDVSFTGDLMGAGTLVFDLDTLDPTKAMYDVGTLDLTGGLTFDVFASDPAAIEDTIYQLVKFDSVNGTLNLDALFSSLDSGLWDYNVGSDNNIWVSYGASETGGGGAAPEPATWVMLLFGAGMVCWLRRRAS